MSDSYDEIEKLKLKVFELEVSCAINELRIRALTFVLAQKEQAMNSNSQLFYDAIREIERDKADEVLRTYSDYEPALTTIAKKYFDEAFPKASH